MTLDLSSQIISCLWSTSMLHGHIYSAQKRRIKLLQEWTLNNTRLLDLDNIEHFELSHKACFSQLATSHFFLILSLDTPSQGSLLPPTLQESRESQKRG